MSLFYRSFPFCVQFRLYNKPPGNREGKDGMVWLGCVTGCVHLLQFYLATSVTALLALYILCFRSFLLVIM